MDILCIATETANLKRAREKLDAKSARVETQTEILGREMPSVS
jgi:hypothetical protein